MLEDLDLEQIPGVAGVVGPELGLAQPHPVERLLGLAVAAACLALATYTRVAYCWYIVPFIVILLFHRVRFRALAIVLSVYFAALLPWAVRNASSFGEIMLSRSANHYLLFYFVPKTLDMNVKALRAGARAAKKVSLGALPQSVIREEIEL